MNFDLDALPDAVLDFLTERHLATLTTIRPGGAPQVTPVGLTYDPEARLARVITWASSVKARTVAGDPGQQVALCQVDGGRWLTLYGPATVSDDPVRVAEAVRRYAVRYRPPKERDDRVVIEILVERMVGRVSGETGAGRRVVGLTGGIGVGKSTAAAILADLGAIIVDCDQLGRDVAARDGAAYPGMVARFGAGIVGADGEIDRPALARIVFNDPDALRDLNGITHPAIDAEISARIAAAPPGSTVVLDMAVLVESDLGKGQYGEVLVIEAPLDQRLDRLARYRGMDPDDARARIASQVSDEDRRAVADHVVVNGGDVEQLRGALEAWWRSEPAR